MRYLAGLIMAAVFLWASLLAYSACKMLILQITHSAYLEQTEGEIIRLEYEEGTRRKINKPRYFHFPIISFQTESGETIVFKGESSGRNSETGKLDYQVGQKIRVLYDPEKKLPPMMDSPYSKSGYAVAAFFGFSFMFASLLFFKLFWRDKSRFRHPSDLSRRFYS